jgi:alanine racemase
MEIKMKKYSRVCANINLDHILYNFNQMNQHIEEDTKIMAVVKADAYGHGAVPISQILEPEEYIWGFGVATAEEGLILRRNHIEKPIHILGYTFLEHYREIIKSRMQPTVFTLEMAKEYSQIALEENTPVEIQIAIDTGMSRIGFRDNEESVSVIKEIKLLPNIIIKGIFTHFAKADASDKEMTYEQIERFQHIIELLEQEGIEIELKHCANSAGLIDIKEAGMDVVRSGIINFGIYPSDEVNRHLVSLKPVLGLKSHIVCVKEVEKEVGVSYGATYITKEPTMIATIPVGYGDGYPRSLSNKGWVLIRGKKAPIIGRVCMDQFMVDVTHIPGAAVNDIVTLVGEDGEEEITVEELGSLSGRFHYEFVCDLGKRIPRCYIYRNQVIGTKDYFEE